MVASIDLSLSSGARGAIIVLLSKIIMKALSWKVGAFHIFAVAAFVVVHTCIIFLQATLMTSDFAGDAPPNLISNTPTKMRFMSPPAPTHSFLSPDHSRYVDSFKESMALGLNFINTHSGCHIASWVATGEEERIKGGRKRHFLQDCIHPSTNFAVTEQRRRLRRPEDMVLIEPHDTVYVNFLQLGYFAQTLLPQVEVPFVLITGQWDIHGVPITTTETANAILDNKFVLHWFCHNRDIYAGGNALHPRVSPWPYGLQGKPVIRGTDPNPTDVYKSVFLKTLGQKKTERIFVSRLKHTTDQRYGIPTIKTRKPIPLHRYLEMMARSHYVISPNGDRPECYRTYEAIGLGTIPLTQLDPIIHGHLGPAPVIFNNTNWNLTRFNKELPHLSGWGSTNRNMIFEKYWMEYAEREVGKPLRWWNVRQARSVRLAEFVTNGTARRVRPFSLT